MRSFCRSIFAVEIMFAVVAGLVGVRAAFGASAALPVRMGYPQPSGAMLPIWVMSDAKIDQKYGVDLQKIYISGGARLTQTDHPKAATADPKEFFDNRFLKELEDTGFVQELYGQR